MTEFDASEGILTPEEVAAIHRVSPDTVRAWARNGLLPAIRTPGGAWRFSRAHERKRAAGELDGQAEG